MEAFEAYSVKQCWWKKTLHQVMESPTRNLKEMPEIVFWIQICCMQIIEKVENRSASGCPEVLAW